MTQKERIDELTAQKLALEIEELKKPFYKKSSFFSLGVPIVAALVTGVIGFFGNAEIQNLNEKQERLTETTQQLVADQQILSKLYVKSIQDYMANLAIVDEYKDNPAALFTRSGMEQIKSNMDAWLNSQKESLVYSRQFSEKFNDLLGPETANDSIQKSNEAIELIEKMQMMVDKNFEDAIRELQ